MSRHLIANLHSFDLGNGNYEVNGQPIKARSHTDALRKYLQCNDIEKHQIEPMSPTSMSETYKTRMEA